MVRSRGTTWVALSLLIVTTWAFNLTKPVHIDDTAYLRMAEHIVQQPLRPMSLVLNWGDDSRPAFDEMNQPPLFFYVLAVAMQVFRSWEVAGHVTLALASGLAVLLCFGVARRVAPRSALLITAACVLGPAFLPAQNIMTDVPLLTCWLATVYFLMRAGEAVAPDRDYALAGVAAAAACLIKYSSLGLLGAFAAVLIGRRHWRGLWALGIPLVALAGWSIWNYELYGRSHLLARSLPADAAAIGVKAIDWMTGLGLAVPWAWLTLARRPFGRWTAIGGSLAVACAVAMFAVMRANRFGDAQAGLVTAILMANGVVAVAAAINAIAAGRTAGGSPLDRDRTLVLGCWLVGAAAIAIGLAPFMALRHVLLAVPPLVLLVIRGHEDWLRSRVGAAGVLILTALPGAALAAADHAWAAVYPRYAAVLAERFPAPPAAVVAVGHWGWQWYAGQRGWREYDRQLAQLSAGHLVFEPTRINRPPFSSEHAARLVHIGVVSVPATALTTIRTAPLYTYSWRMGIAPVAFSRSPVETFNVYRALR
jgi:4-amino-4-deoxy-L-arabinose transferase-like glycosyltransferase